MYNLRAMPREVALKFVADIDKLADIAVVFEDRKHLDESLVLHTLEEHRLETSASLEFMTLFVAATDESFSDVVDVFQSSMSDDGYIFGLRVPPLKTKSWSYFSDKSVLQRVYDGRCKVVSAPDFFRRFRCSCPSVTSWSYPCPILTMFLHHDRIRHEGQSMDHFPTLSYYLRVFDPDNWGLVRLPPLGKRAYVPRATPTELILENEPLPGLSHGFGRFQQRFEFGNHWIIFFVGNSFLFFWRFCFRIYLLLVI